MKTWIGKAIEFLDHSLGKIPQEINELDWKESLSPKNEKLCHHICAFANLPGGGFLVFGIEDTAKTIGLSKPDADVIVDRLSSLCRDRVSPLVGMDHAIVE